MGRDADHGLLADNEVTDAGGNGISLSNHDNATVIDNVATDNEFGLNLNDVTNSTISDTDFSRSSGDAVLDVNGDVQGTVVENNTLSDGWNIGVRIGESDGLTLRNNEISDNSDEGIEVSASFSNVVRNLTVEGNNITENRLDGIVDESSIDAVYADNYIADNEGGTNVKGIEVTDDTSNVTIRENTIENHEDNGIEIDHGGTFKIRNNVVRENKAGSSISFSAGIEVASASSGIIAENEVIDNEFGVRVSVDSQDITVVHNNFDLNPQNATEYDVDAPEHYLNATYNWWGAENGPSGGAQDPVTGEFAVGDGDGVDENVTFYPWEGESPSDFEITDFETNSPVDEGESLELTVTIDNVGTASGKQEIQGEVDDVGSDSTDLSLDDGESTTVTLTVPTEAGDVGTHEATVSSQDDSDDVTVEVMEGEADIEVSGHSPDPDPAEADFAVGDTLSTEAVVTNHGSAAGEFEVEFIVEEMVVDSESVDVDGDDTKTVDLEHELSETGSKMVSVNDVDPVQIFVDEPEFVIETVETNSPVDEGESLAVHVTVHNAGTVSGTRMVDLLVDSDQDGEFAVEADQQELYLDGDQTETITLTYSTATGDAPEVAVQARTDGDTVTTSASVSEPEPDPEPPGHDQAEAHFDVTITHSNSPLDPGETAVIEAEITNAGDGTGTQTIEFNVSDQMANESMTIAPGNSESVTFEWQTTADDIGTQTATIASEDDADNTTISVTVDNPAFVSAHVADATPIIVDITFDQAVFVDDDMPTDGFGVSVDGSIVDLETASADGPDVALELAEAVEAEQDLMLSYDGDSDNVVNEYDREAHAFETGDVDNRVEPVAANLTAIDPTTNEARENFSVGVTVDDGVIFSAEDSLVPPGEEATYEWQVGEESFTTTEPELVEELLEPGTYEASVTVVVGDRSDIAEFTLDVVDETPPDVRLTATETVEVGEDPELDASESSDNVAIAEFEWDFDDGTTDAGANLTQPEHSFDEAGEYEVTVTVTDTSGNSAQNSTTITVEEEPDEGMSVLPVGLGLLLVAAAVVAGYYYMRRQ